MHTVVVPLFVGRLLLLLPKNAVATSARWVCSSLPHFQNQFRNTRVCMCVLCAIQKSGPFLKAPNS